MVTGFSGRRVLRRSAGTASLVATLGVTALAAAAGLSCGHVADAAARDPRPALASPGVVTVGPGWTLIAKAKGVTDRFAAPGGRITGTIPARWYGAPSALPVIGQQPGWLEVRLPTRPNGSTAWVRSADMSLTETPYRVDVDLKSRHLELFKQGSMILDAPAGIGTADDPTPSGSYFVVLFEQAPNPGYGPFILVTSAHSNAIGDWQQSGDALIGIHGPLGDDAAIGTAGAALSHGCIRLHDTDLEQLRQVPAGSPLTIGS